MNIVYYLGVFLLVFFLYQRFMISRMTKKKGKETPVLSNSSYDKAAKSGKPTLFYFYSPRCGACKTMTPLVEEYANNERCFKIDISKDMATAREFGVMGTPSTIVTENGTISEFMVGPRSESLLKPFLEQTG